MPSFDIASEANIPEVNNAIIQVRKEIETRYDFRGAKASIELTGHTIMLLADDKMKLEAMQEITRQRLAKRGIGLRMVVFNDPVPAGGDMLRQEVEVKAGLTSEELKRLGKVVRDMKVKVTAQIQGEQLRVTGKNRDDLQGVIQHLKSSVDDIDLQFLNFRD